MLGFYKSLIQFTRVHFHTLQLMISPFLHQLYLTSTKNIRSQWRTAPLWKNVCSLSVC